MQCNKLSHTVNDFSENFPFCNEKSTLGIVNGISLKWNILFYTYIVCSDVSMTVKFRKLSLTFLGE